MLGTILEISRAIVLGAASWALTQLADSIAFVADRALGADEEEARVGLEATPPSSV